MKVNYYLLLILAIIFITAGNAHATSWEPAKVECPICKTSNNFQKIVSYGSYIFRWPSKFQYVFWPATNTCSIYSCMNCHLTCFMWDFKDIPDSMHNRIKEQLLSVEIGDKAGDYTDIPVSEKLGIAERVYSVIEENNDLFWCKFYRISGYHFEKEEKKNEARVARQKSLDFAVKLLSQSKYRGMKKELYIIAGAMNSALEDYPLAAACFKKSLKLKYDDPDKEREYLDGFNKYLSQLAESSIERIKDFQGVSEVLEKDVGLLLSGMESNQDANDGAGGLFVLIVCVISIIGLFAVVFAYRALKPRR